MARDGEVVVCLEGVRRVFADFWGRPRVVAVDDLSFEIRAGEIFGLLGPNGAGKSTTVKMILDLLRPTRGRIAILGRPPSDLRAKARIGYLPEETRLYPYLTGRETLLFFARLFDLPRSARRERVEQLLEMVGLSGAAGRRTGEYSKGMQRRLGLAQALLNDPDLVILDEPTAGLDPLGAREVKDLLLHLAGRGKTVLLCSHLLAEVEDVCDRVQVLYAGRTLAAGRLDELLADERELRLALPALAPEALSRVLEVARREAGEVTVQVPRRSLESFFLELVSAARDREHQPTQHPPAPFLAGAGGLESLLPEAEPGMVTDEAEASPPSSLGEADRSLRERFGLDGQEPSDG